MASDTLPQIQDGRLGIAPPGSILSYLVSPVDGFFVDAILECEMNFAAKWNSVEILTGSPVTDKLVPPGIYALHLSVAFVSEQVVDVTMDFSLTPPPGAGATATDQLVFSGKLGDVGRGLILFKIA